MTDDSHRLRELGETEASLRRIAILVADLSGESNQDPRPPHPRGATRLTAWRPHRWGPVRQALGSRACATARRLSGGPSRSTVHQEKEPSVSAGSRL